MRFAEIVLRVGASLGAWMIFIGYALTLAVLPRADCDPTADTLWRGTLMLGVTSALALAFAGPAMAQPGHAKGHKGHGNKHQQHQVMGWGAGGCPLGLAKKNNGCMPPGQAKKWHYGRPLPREVVFYEVPRALVIELPPPPSGYRYVRVASDILMIAVGTGMVVDAITDLGAL